jgi:histidinol dehydrogenase
MQYIEYPDKARWNAILRRPDASISRVFPQVKPILKAVREQGDAALRRLTHKFDGFYPDSLAVSEAEIDEAKSQISKALQEALKTAVRNITAFHEAQKTEMPAVETMKGVICWQKKIPIERIGLYIPGGSAPLFSTLLMLAVPAKIAGCGQIIVCTPPDREGRIHPAILFAAGLTGVTEIYKIGGAQAIAAMAYGAETIPKVYKIFGPGNRFVTAAKQLVSLDDVAIDLPAGPSEVAVLADHEANAGFIASDLLSQAEHGADSQVVFVTPDSRLVKRVQAAIDEQLAVLPRRAIAAEALKHSKIILVRCLEEGMAFLNDYAPEHLILHLENAQAMADKVINAGSVFIGAYSPESTGDYASGTNHTLPTHGYAKNYSGVNLDSFMKTITFQRITPEGLQKIGPSVETMAEAEMLHGHKNAVTLRLQSLKAGGAN